MVVFPLVATGVSAVFALLLLRRWTKRRQLPQLAWGVSMAMFAVASLAVVFGTTQDWDPTLYRIFYLFGAVLTVPWLALGSVALFRKPAVTGGAVAIVALATIWGVVKVASVDTCEAVEGSGRHRQCAAVITQGNRVFGHRDIPVFQDAWLRDSSPRKLAFWYSVAGALVVIGIALRSSRARGDRRPPPERVRGNTLIAVGVAVVGIGGTAVARFARGSVFSVLLAVGVSVMFVGFLLASRAPHTEQRSS